MSNSDDDKTVFVSPPTRAPTPAPSRPIVLPPDGDDEADDKTVMMKPSQRNREAAAALSMEREKQIENRQAPEALDLSSDTVDFDVSGAPTEPPRRKRARPNYAWLAGFFGTIAFAAVCAWLVYFFR